MVNELAMTTARMMKNRMAFRGLIGIKYMIRRLKYKVPKGLVESLVNWTKMGASTAELDSLDNSRTVWLQAFFFGVAINFCFILEIARPTQNVSIIGL